MTRPAAPGTAPASVPLLDADDPALFPKLTDQQVELLARRGEVRPTAVGPVLFRQGSETYDVMVVREGTVSVIVGNGEEERELVKQGPGDLMVELNLFTGQGTGATGIVREPGSVLAVPADEFRELVGRDLSFGTKATASPTPSTSPAARSPPAGPRLWWVARTRPDKPR